MASKLIQARGTLQADEKEMARHLKTSLAIYKELESGARLLPLPAQKQIDKHLKGLLDRCGLK